MRALLLIAALIGIQDSAPRYDWPAFLQELLSRDASTRSAAQEHLFQNVLPELSSRSPTELKPDLILLMRTMREAPAVRVEASAVLAALQAKRADTSEAFEPILSATLDMFQDEQARVRRNAVFLILNLKPSIPDIAVPRLIAVLDDSDSETVRGAVLSLARLCKNGAAAEALAKLMASESKTNRIFALGGIGFARCTDYSVLKELGRILESESDRDVLLLSLQSLARLGSEARMLRPEMERLALRSPDEEVARLAADIAQRLP